MQAIPGLSEWVMATIKLRLYTSVRSKTTAVRTTVCSEDAQVLREEVMNLLEKAIEIVSPAQSESGLYSRCFLIPKKTVAWPATYSRSQTLESHPGKKVVQDDHIEADPLANMPRGLVHVAGSERRLLSYPGSPPITYNSWDSHSRGWRINTRSSRLGCPWLPTLLRDAWMRLSPLCDRWESASSTTSTAHSGPVTGSFNIAQNPPPQPLMLPGAQGQLCQEHTVTQPTSIIPGHSYQLRADDRNCLSRVSHDESAPNGFLQGRDRRMLKAFQKMLGLMATSSPVLQLGLLRMWPIQFWLKQRVPSA